MEGGGRKRREARGAVSSLGQGKLCIDISDLITPFTPQGDSGGPLVCNGKAHGIVSYGHKNRIFPKVFTRVSYFEPWIRKELRKFALQDLPDSPSSY